MAERPPAALHYVVIGCALGVAAADFLFDHYFGGFYPGFGIRLAVDLAVLCGILIQSKFFRFAGGAYFAVTAVSMVWPVIVTGQYEFGIALIWIAVVTILSSAAAYLLLLSKKFRAEFAALRAHDPLRYKLYLRRGYIALLGAAVVVATLFDLYNLAIEQ